MQAAKGSSNPPVSEWVLRLIEANAVASYHLHWALAETERSAVKSSEGIYYSDILKSIRYNAGAVNHWRDKDPLRWRAFMETVRHVAKGVMFVHGRTDKERAALEALMNRTDSDALKVWRAPNDEEESRGRTRRGQVIDTMHTRRLMVEQLEAVERSTGYRGLEAMEILSERKKREGKDWSVASIRKAREVINRERRGEDIEEKADRYHYEGSDGDAA